MWIFFLQEMHKFVFEQNCFQKQNELFQFRPVVRNICKRICRRLSITVRRGTRVMTLDHVAFECAKLGNTMIGVFNARCVAFRIVFENYFRMGTKEPVPRILGTLIVGWQVHRLKMRTFVTWAENTPATTHARNGGHAGERRININNRR